MSLDVLPDLEPGPGEILDTELFVSDDVLVKAFALGAGASVDPHEHAGATNVFHVVAGAVVVTQDGNEDVIEAPGVVPNERGVTHGARNETDEPAVLTASLAPMP